jgi:hypothetical protein
MSIGTISTRRITEAILQKVRIVHLVKKLTSVYGIRIFIILAIFISTHRWIIS